MVGGDGRHWRLVFNLLAAATCIALLIGSWALYARFTEANRIRTQQAQVWHAVVCAIETAETKNPKDTPADRHRFLVFWDRLLVVDVGAAPCQIDHGR